ncbi:MAG: hypothetical protein CMH50_09825, partial [Myxococcales bacterium]|nr:hypothetical protein [Myxococcales bacterium]
CLADCRDASCGDGFVHIGVEDCDDNNLVPGDGCDGECQSEVEFQGAGDEAVAEGIAFARYTWAQAGTNNNGQANAAAACQQRGGRLAVPNSQAQWDAFYSLITRDSYGWWMGGHNNFSCGNATPGSPKAYSAGLIYVPTGGSRVYTGCNCTPTEQGLVAYHYTGQGHFDGCQRHTPNGELGIMDENIDYSHGDIHGFICQAP